jgi:uncharacterized protein (TIRG00374 family)
MWAHVGRLGRRLIVVTFLAIAVFAGFSVYADVSKLGARLGSVAPWAVAAALALALANYLLRFVRWHLYLGAVGAEAPTSASVLVFLSGFALSVTPGKVGELVKAVLLKAAAGTDMARTAPVVVAERLTDLLALVLLSLAGVALYGVAAPVVIGGAAFVGIGLVVLSNRRLAHVAIGLVTRPQRFQRFASRLRDAYDHLERLVRPGPLGWATALAVVAWLCECVGFALIVGGFPGASVSLGLATVIYAATTIAGAFSFLPGGLLVTEGAMIFLLVSRATGLDQAGAVAATLVTRLCTLWFAVILGLGALLLLRRLRPAAAEVL